VVELGKEFGKKVLTCLSKTSLLGLIRGITCPLIFEGPQYFDCAKVA